MESFTACVAVAYDNRDFVSCVAGAYDNRDFVWAPVSLFQFPAQSDPVPFFPCMEFVISRGKTELANLFYLESWGEMVKGTRAYVPLFFLPGTHLFTADTSVYI